jgi:hypothetical protein
MSDLPPPPAEPVDAREALRTERKKGRGATFLIVLVLGLGIWGCTKVFGKTTDDTKARSDCEVAVIMKLGLSSSVSMDKGTTSHTGDIWRIGGGVSANGAYRTFICTEEKQSDGSFNTLSISGLG